MPAPRPGSPVRGSTTGRPIMAAMDLLGRRWALRIIWELRTGPVGARALLARCQGLSSSVLYQRLAELTTSGLITATTNGYQLTPLGASLGRALAPLDAWASTWAQTQTPTDQANQALPLQSAHRRLWPVTTTRSACLSQGHRASRKPYRTAVTRTGGRSPGIRPFLERIQRTGGRELALSFNGLLGGVRFGPDGAVRELPHHAFEEG
jgi:DNA-binding HxlR family transcriptional regulator